MWEDGFVNEPHMLYKHKCYYKHWLIGQIDLVGDLINDIQKNSHILQSYRREFKIPDINLYVNKFVTDEYYIDVNGVIFVKSLLTKHKHYRKDRETCLIYENVNGVVCCTQIIFYYEADQFHYYSVDIRNSKIINVRFTKQSYTIEKYGSGIIHTLEFKQVGYGNMITLIDPHLISF